MAQRVFAVPFGYEYRSGSYLGRGDTGIASSKGMAALMYNPAGIGLGKNLFNEFSILSPQVEFTTSIKSLYDNMNGDSSNSTLVTKLQSISGEHYFGAAQADSGLVMKNFAIGAIGRAELNAFASVDSSNIPNSLSLSMIERHGFYLGTGTMVFGGHLAFGATGKYVKKNELIVDLDSTQIVNYLNQDVSKLVDDKIAKGSAFGLDLGTMVIIDEPSESHIGFVVRDIGMKYFDVITATAPRTEPVQLDGGFSTSFGTKRGRFKIYGDYRDIFNEQNYSGLVHAHLGVEYNLKNIFIVMAGMNEGYLTYGASLNFKIIRLDGGYYGEEVGSGSTRVKNGRYFARISLGWFM